MMPQPDVSGPGGTPASSETKQTLTDMIMGFRITQMIYVAAKLEIADFLERPRDR